MNNLIPEEIYKRKHYGTPQSALLIVSNYTVFAFAVSVFAAGKTINWFFWVAMGLLAIYNVFNIRKDREEYTRTRIIAYVLSLLTLVGMFLLFRSKA
jgi:hypothetical protein